MIENICNKFCDCNSLIEHICATDDVELAEILIEEKKYTKIQILNIFGDCSIMNSAPNIYYNFVIGKDNPIHTMIYGYEGYNNYFNNYDIYHILRNSKYDFLMKVCDLIDIDKVRIGTKCGLFEVMIKYDHIEIFEYIIKKFNINVTDLDIDDWDYYFLASETPIIVSMLLYLGFKRHHLEDKRGYCLSKIREILSDAYGYTEEVMIKLCNPDYLIKEDIINAEYDLYNRAEVFDMDELYEHLVENFGKEK